MNDEDKKEYCLSDHSVMLLFCWIAIIIIAVGLIKMAMSYGWLLFIACMVVGVWGAIKSKKNDK